MSAISGQAAFFPEDETYRNMVKSEPLAELVFQIPLVGKVDALRITYKKEE